MNDWGEVFTKQGFARVYSCPGPTPPGNRPQIVAAFDKGLRALYPASKVAELVLSRPGMSGIIKNFE